jgi:O-antigen/teichoic acid export membrane protein
LKKILDRWCPHILLELKGRIEASPIGYRLARGAFWSLVGSIIARGLGLLSGIFVARVLGKAEFGQLGMIQNTVGMFGVFAGLGLGLTATKHVAEYKATAPARAGRIIGLSSLVAWGSGALVTAILFLLSPWLAARTLAAPELSGVLQIGCMLLLLGAVNGAQTGALAGFEAFKSIARVSLIAGVLSFPITIACALYLGVRGAVLSQILTMFTNAGLNYLALRQEAARAGVPLGYTGCFQEWPILWSFSLPAVLGSALAGPVTWVASALLVNQANGYSEMGVYSAALRMKGIPELVLSMVMAPLLPVLSEQFGRGQTAVYNKTLRYAFGLSLLIIVPVSLVQIAAPALTMLPFGADYSIHSASTVQWLMVHAAFFGVFYPFGSVLLSTNRTWFAFWYNVGYSSLLLVMTLLLVPRFAGTGLASAVALSYVTASLACVIHICRRERSFIGDIRLSPVIWMVFLSITACAALARLLNPIAATFVSSGLVAILMTCSLRRILLRF